MKLPCPLLPQTKISRWNPAPVNQPRHATHNIFLCIHLQYLRTDTVNTLIMRALIRCRSAKLKEIIGGGEREVQNSYKMMEINPLHIHCKLYTLVTGVSLCITLNHEITT